MKNKKLLLGLLSVSLVGTLLTGCSFGKKEKAPAEPTYELTAYTLESEGLAKNWFYVKDGDNIYPVSSANKKTYTESIECKYVYSSTMEVPEDTSQIDYDYEDDPSRAVMYNGKDVCIPTIYKDQQLIYISDGSEIPSTFTLERFYDQGWSLGMYNLSATDSGKIQGVVSADNFFQDSNFHKQLTDSGKVSADNIIIFDTVNSAAVTADNIGPGGYIQNLKKDQEYPVRLYRGSDLISFDTVKADIHYYTGFEKYAFNEYNYSEAGYVTVQLPSFLQSGYYYINDIGMFRYINAYASDGINIEEVDFNVPYYYTDENGITYTNANIKNDDTQGSTSTEEKVETENQDGTVYTNKFTVDSSLKSLVVKIKYEDATAKINGEKVSLSDAEVGLPSAKIIDPDGKEYLMETTESHTLAYTFDGAIMGEYTVELYNCSQRLFTFDTSAVTGNSDSLVHTGNGAQSLTYYLKNSYKNGIFTITWENTSHAANIVIVGPDGTQYGKSIDETQIVKDDYGVIQIRTGEVKYGDYVIRIEGEDLGRVLVTAAESQTELPEETTEAPADTTETTEAAETTEATTEAPAESTEATESTATTEVAQ